MELLLIQSQEHETLPIAELKAVLSAENIDAIVEVINNGLVILKSLNKDDFYDSYEKLVKRLAYTHEIHEMIFRHNFEDLTKYFSFSDEKIDKNNIISDFTAVDWNKYLFKNFAVRVKRFNKVGVDTILAERKLGAIIKASNDNFSVQLENPDSFIRVVVCESNVFVGICKYKINKKHFQEMKPHKRPFFYPGSMSPKLARCMVNLSQIKENQCLLDPFCGTGGILIEAGLIGTKLIGSDINWKMKNGTSINLDFCKITNYDVYHCDVRELKLYDKVDAVVTDPPYGISTSTGGEESEKIFHQFLQSIANNMKENGLLCIASPHYLDLDSILKDLSFELLERHEIKMHKSLTRIISVIVKIN
jgi:tRNA (guanine10-N2)-dimethyltransferase